MLLKLILVLLITGITSAEAAPRIKKLIMNPARTVKLLDVVNGPMAVQAMGQIDRLSKQLDKKDKYIYLLINSPGGSIFAGNLIINSMRQARARGARIICASTVYAASMAFQFLMECDERFALRYTKLLFHPPRVMFQGPLLKNQMLILSKELQAIEDKMIPTIQSVLQLPESEFKYHYERETFWDAEDLLDASPRNWIKIVDVVEGLKDTFQLWPDRGFGMRNKQTRQMFMPKESLIWIAPLELTTPIVGNQND